MFCSIDVPRDWASHAHFPKHECSARTAKEVVLLSLSKVDPLPILQHGWSRGLDIDLCCCSRLCELHKNGRLQCSFLAFVAIQIKMEDAPFELFCMSDSKLGIQLLDNKFPVNS